MPTTLPVRPRLKAARPAGPGSYEGQSLATVMERVRHRWGWFVTLGVVVSLLGIAALILVVHATIVTVYTIAVFMIVAGGGEVAMGLGAKTWSRFFLWVVAGVFYIVAGAFALAQPVHAAIALTLMLGIALVATGAVRIAIGTHLAAQARTMVILGGAVTSLVGLLVIVGWPNNSVVILGALLGVDLLFSGLTWIGFGLRLRLHA